MDTRCRKIRNILIFTMFHNLVVSITQIFYELLTNKSSIQSNVHHSMFDGIQDVTTYNKFQLSLLLDDIQRE